ncbi:sigma-70 family RNA polymerase sigma factor [Shewanella salipaludis]|uniref:Sigma-70 family RNA polymerase sigma factor n=1 Tax=Shewanella salipaludis TaxID=2723052 RepID=A0A972FT95_9GAMM|nr:sigma-70 family RNA polymerase sigma factor [Shewanella salipaludis]NMH65808.1 sigma-70 family RNA polymerase sigma factor [Shewanella salipaludis]
MLSYGRGDIEAFERLYLKHKGALYRYFVRQMGDKQLAEDLYQETWSRVIKAASTYQHSAKFTTWLYRIAHNLLIDHVRAVKPLSEFTEEQQQDMGQEPQALADSYRPDVELMQAYKASLLKTCIGLLPQVQKEAFLLNMEMGFTAAVISDIAGVTLEATKSRIRYAHRSLKDCVAAKWQGGSHEIQ